MFKFESGKVLKHGNVQQLNAINKLNVEIDFFSKQIEEKHSIFNNEIKVKREDFIRKIKKITEKDSVSGKNLNLQFEYHCVVIENITLEHKKKIKFNEMKKKNFQINKLVNQIKLRDEVIESANAEMKKRKITIDMSDDIKELNDLDIEQSILLPLIVNKNNVISKENTNHLKTKSDVSNKPNASSHHALPLINIYNVPKTPTQNKSPDSSPSK